MQNLIFSIKNLIKKLNEKLSSVIGLRITLTNEIKDIIKVIPSLENRGILLKGTTEKISSNEAGF